MSSVNVTAVTCLDNPARFTNPFQFEIYYECLRPLPKDLDWKLTYVGSAEDEKYDQVLDSVLVGSEAIGTYRFVFQADPPDWTKIPADDLCGVTVLLLTCSYNGKEFIRIGYYVNVDYEDQETRDDPPETPDVGRLVRNILADKPRVTKFSISWDDEDGLGNKENTSGGGEHAAKQMAGGEAGGAAWGAANAHAGAEVEAGGEDVDMDA